MISQGYGATEGQTEVMQFDFDHTTPPPRTAGEAGKYWTLKQRETSEGRKFDIFTGGPNWPCLLFPPNT